MAAHLLSFPPAGRNTSQNADPISPSLKNASIKLAGDAAFPAALRTGQAFVQPRLPRLAWPVPWPVRPLPRLTAPWAELRLTPGAPLKPTPSAFHGTPPSLGQVPPQR